MTTRSPFAYYASVKANPVEWLWYPYIPYGKLTLLEGDPGEGKSSFMLGIASLLSRGEKMPDGFHTPNPEYIVYQCSEDGLSDTIKPRLVAAGADCDRIAYIIDEDGSLNMEDSRIEHTIASIGARLFVIDPIQSFLPQRGDLTNAGRIRSVLGRLSLVAAKHRCAIVMIGHMNKSTSGKSLYRGLGSIDIAAICRSVMMVMRDSDNEDIRYMLHVKSSLAPKGNAIRFDFGAACQVRWLGTCDITLHDVDATSDFKDYKRNLAMDTMLDILANKPQPSASVIETLIGQGCHKRTIYAVKKELDIQSFKIKSTWYWKLPDS